MSITLTYSKSLKGLPDVFTYDSIPRGLQIQICHIWNDFFMQEQIPSHIREKAYKEITDVLCKEHEMLHFPPSYNHNHSNEPTRLFKYMEALGELNKILDVIQLVFQFIEYVEPYLQDNSYMAPLPYKAVEAIEDLNHRFKEHGVGYEFINSRLIRSDKTLLHKETVQETFIFLHESEWATVNSEYLTAHERFRLHTNAGNQECLIWTLKAFESTCKIICGKNAWTYEQDFPAKKLIRVLFEHNFFPSTYESAMAALRQFLESSIPTFRNKFGGHGSGEVDIIVPHSLAQYMLYITGSTIRMMLELQKERSNS